MYLRFTRILLVCCLSAPLTPEAIAANEYVTETGVLYRSGDGLTEYMKEKCRALSDCGE